jgi:hypothetical protein
MKPPYLYNSGKSTSERFDSFARSILSEKDCRNDHFADLGFVEGSFPKSANILIDNNTNIKERKERA